MVLFVVLILVPIVELYVIVQTAQEIGVAWTIVALIAISVAGTYLLMREGRKTWRKLRETLRSGELPTDEASDGAMILLGGALLLTPGFVTDVLGLSLIFPTTRRPLKGAFRALMGVFAFSKLGRAGKAGVAGYKVHEAHVSRVRRREEEATSRPSSPLPPPTLPSEESPDGEAGSRDTA